MSAFGFVAITADCTAFDGERLGVGGGDSEQVSLTDRRLMSWSIHTVDSPPF